MPPCGGHLLLIALAARRREFQVVPPCGGHLGQAVPGQGSVFVSSRAPVWGASLRCDVRDGDLSVSSRAPVWGASSLEEYLGEDIPFQVVPPCGGHPFR